MLHNSLLFSFHVLTCSCPQHGQETLDNLSKLKPGLVDRYDRWVTRYPHLADEPSLRPAVLFEAPAPSIPSSADPRNKEEKREDPKREEAKRRESEEAERRRYDEQARGPSRGAPDDSARQRVDERRLQEQAGIVQRQHEAEAAAHAARR